MTKPIHTADSYKSGLERNYAERLDLLKHAGEIVEWRYEGIKFKLGKGAWYTPDFLVVYEDRFELHETKGFWREAALVRIKVAASAYPWYRFVVVQCKKKVWTFRSVKP